MLNLWKVMVELIEKKQSFPMAKFPWNRVSVDILSFQNKSYLVVVDANSNWIELISIKSKSAWVVLKKIKDFFLNLEFLLH